MELKELEKNFIGIGEVKGINFKQVYSSEFAYIYERTDINTIYEIFERRNTAVCIDFENREYSETEFKEIYPKSSAFGIWAWTCSDKEQAWFIVNGIESRLLEKE